MRKFAILLTLSFVVTSVGLLIVATDSLSQPAAGSGLGNATTVIDASKYPSIQAAVAAAGSNAQVIVPRGAYSVSSPISISGLNHFSLLLKAGAAITSNDLPGIHSVIEIVRGSNNVSVIGEQGSRIVANSGARGCVGVNHVHGVAVTTIYNIRLSGFECSGGLDGIDIGDPVNFTMTTSKVEIDHLYVHNTTRPMGGQINAQAVTDADIDDNILESPAATQSQVVCTIDVDCKVHNNTLKGFVPPASGTNPVAALNAFYCDGCDFYENKISMPTGSSAPMTGTGGIYCDTCFNSQIHDNYIWNGYYGITVEINHITKVYNNHLFQQSADGILAYGTTTVHTVNSWDSTTGGNCGTNVTCEIDTTLRKAAAGSLQAVTSGSFTTGPIFEQDGKLQLGPAEPDLRIWMYGDAAIPAGQLGMKLCSAAGGGGSCFTSPCGAAPAATWVPCYARVPVRNAPQPWASYEIVALTSAPNATFHFDELKTGRVSDSITVDNNVVEKPRGAGISISGGHANVAVNNNVIKEVGFGQTPGNPSWGIRFVTDAGHVQQNIAAAGNVITDSGHTKKAVGLAIENHGGTMDIVNIGQNQAAAMSGGAFNRSGAITNMNLRK